jgi:hypothetical protein
MIQLSPPATHGAVKKRSDLKTGMAGEDRSWPAGRRNLLPESRSTGRTIMAVAASHFLNRQDIPRDPLEGWNLEGCSMSEARNFRRWAAQVARQAGEEPDANEAQRLLSIAEYWVRLAEIEDWQRDRPGPDTSH